MAALATAPVRISTSRLREQACGGIPAARRVPTVPRTVPAVLLGAMAVLAVSSVLPGAVAPGAGGATSLPVPGHGSVGQGSDSDPAALPQTGARPGSSGTEVRPAAAAASAVSSCVGPCSTAQVLSVTVRPGTLSLTAAQRAITVHVGADGSGRARLAGLTVTDLRGVGAGWTLSSTVADVVDAATGSSSRGAVVELAPTCRRSAGPLTLRTAEVSLTRVGGTAALCVVPVASSGSLAGGVVEAAADIAVRGVRPGTTVRVVLRTSLV